MIHPRDRQILQIALPSIVSNITVPLLGMVDVAIVGHMGSAVYIGAVAVGSMIFNLVYWLFAFLRMGTSGLTSQSLGRRELAEVAAMLPRGLAIALAIALVLLLGQVPLCWLMMQLIGPTPDVLPHAVRYFHIVIWGAPASLGLFSISGWLVGMQNTRTPMFISIMQNVVNILLSLVLVYGLDMKIEGVALGTVVAQYAGLVAALLLVARYYGRLFRHRVTGLFRRQAMLRFFSVNRDIFLRTLCLVSVNLYFTSAGASHGAVVLSVNTVMMQLYLLFSYFMDGFAYAGEALCGRYYGARNTTAFTEVFRRLWIWAAAVTLLYMALYALAGMDIVRLLTDEPAVRLTAHTYIGWAALVPLAGAAAFILDGVFIGITLTRGILLSSAVAAAMFFTVYFLTASPLGNHGLWLAQVVYLSTRGIVQAIIYHRRFHLT